MRSCPRWPTTFKSIFSANKSVLGALAFLCALAWGYLFYVRAGMSQDMSAAMPMMAAWTAAEFIAMFLMWAIMMVAMMLPSAMPMVMLYARVTGHRATRGRRQQPVIRDR